MMKLLELRRNSLYLLLHLQRLFGPPPFLSPFLTSPSFSARTAPSLLRAPPSQGSSPPSGATHWSHVFWSFFPLLSRQTQFCCCVPCPPLEGPPLWDGAGGAGKDLGSSPVIDACRRGKAEDLGFAIGGGAPGSLEGQGPSPAAPSPVGGGDGQGSIATLLLL